MYDPNKVFDPFAFIVGNTDMSSWNTSYLNDFIRDLIMRSVNAQTQANSSWDYSKLSANIFDIINQALTTNRVQHGDPLENNPPIPSTTSESVNMLQESTSAEEKSNLGSDLDDNETIENQNAAHLPTNRPESIDSDYCKDNINVKEQELTHDSVSLNSSIGIQPEVIQTHSMVVIRLKLPGNMSEKDLKITFSDDHAVIKWPLNYLEQIIPLPTDIIQNKVLALIRDDILEIQIPRRCGEDLRRIIL